MINYIYLIEPIGLAVALFLLGEALYSEYCGWKNHSTEYIGGN